MKVISTFHPSSSVLSSVKCRLVTRDLEHLVVAKLSRLDVYSIRSHGLQHECGVNVWGKICSVKALPLSDTGYDTRSHMLVMITHPEPELLVLEYTENEGVGGLTVKKQVSLFERLPRVAEFFTNFIVHPSGRLAVVSCYAGKLKVVTFKGGNYQEDFDVSLPEINIFSLAFLPSSDDDYALAILHLDSQERLQLCTRDLDVSSLDLSQQFSTLMPPTLIPEKFAPYPTDSALHLIPVQPDVPDDILDVPEDSFLGGIIVAESQEKQKGKQKRLESKKKGKDAAEAAKARAKEQERGNRRRKPKAVVDWPWNELTAWSAIDHVPFRFLLGDSFGRLLMLSLDNVNELGMVLVPLGETSPATSLTYLTNQVVYLGSHLGDSQLLQLSSSENSQEVPSALTIPEGLKTVSKDNLLTTSSKKGKEKAAPDNDMDIDSETPDNYSKGRIVEPTGSYITVLETYKNLAPIMDAILVDVDGSGQSQIVTCSGGANTGSLNVVRNGADFKEMAFVPGLTDVARIWSVHTVHDESNDSHILLSTINETHLFQLNEYGAGVTLRLAEAVSLGGLISNQPTLAFSNFCKRENGVYNSSYLFVQVVPTGAFLLEWDIYLESFVERASWEVRNTAGPGSRPLEVVAASINPSQVALALSGGEIVLLCIENGAKQFRQLITHSTFSEISAISFSPLDPKKFFSTLLVVSYWSTNTIELFTLREGILKSEMRTKSPPLPAVVRSLLFTGYHPYLLAGLGDGSVASLQWRDGALKDLKIISLGRSPVTLTPCEVEGRKTVFAAGNQAMVFYCEKNRLASSAIMLKEISAASKLNTKLFTSSLILASPTGLYIGSIKDLNKMHIRTAKFGLENPRRIAHAPSLKAFGVGCTRVEPGRIGTYESLTSSFHVVDDNSLSRLGQYQCEPDEEITAVLSFNSIVENESKPFFCLGTMLYKPEEKEPSVGRLLIFTAYTATGTSKTSSLELSLVASAEVQGCVFALKYVNDKIVAAVNSSILLYNFDVSLEESQAPVFSLKRLAEWNHNYMVTSLGSFNDHIAAGDQISSVSLLKVTGDKILSEARDYGPLYPVAVEALSVTNIIVSNDTLNVLIFALGKQMRGEALEAVGSFHLADMATKFLRGSISAMDKSQETNKLSPEVIFFTSSGRIGVVTDIQDNELSLHLTELQRNLASVISGVGSVSHTRFRAPKNTRGTSDADGSAYGFIDGDFLEQFLGLQGNPEKLEKVMKGGSEPETLKMSVDNISRFLEQLQSLH
ncbi:CPSF A subunit region-domain-containing protein [Gymnopilus junonius]|uniref:CPSF A subunit region-domain-containing protein n=1 Tax=Gymnopilus junonius TaxID=109634 RepID=A0A9P5NYH4_GYMJU|nr:CPSF A subunit region-domain-containing protein [Gymnopilus junonius]